MWLKMYTYLCIRFFGIIRFLWEIIKGSTSFLGRMIIFHIDFKGSISDTVYLWNTPSEAFIVNRCLTVIYCSVVCDSFALLFFIVPYVWPILSLHDCSELSFTQGRVVDFISLSLLFSSSIHFCWYIWYMFWCIRCFVSK